MRLLTLAAALAALPAAAQPALSDSSDAYLRPMLGIAVSDGTSFVVGLDAGRRLGAFDVGVRALAGDVTYGRAGAYVEVGPQVGLTRRFPSGLEADARAIATGAFADLGLADDDGFELRVVRATAQATLGMPYPLAGTVRLAPTGGLYGTACSTVGFDPADPDDECAEAGALVGVDVRFRAFGAGVSVPLIVGVPVVGNDRAGRVGVFGVPTVPVMGGLRVGF